MCPAHQWDGAAYRSRPAALGPVDRRFPARRQPRGGPGPGRNGTVTWDGGRGLANTTGRRSDHQRSAEVFRRLGGDEAAAIAERDFADPTEESLADYRRVCHPLYSSKPGDAETLRQRRARSIQTTEVNRHYFPNEASRFDPWSAAEMIKCPVLILAGEDDPVCLLPIAEDLASRLPAGTTRLLRLPGARHTIFHDRPDIAFPAVQAFIRRIKNSEPAHPPPAPGPAGSAIS